MEGDAPPEEKKKRKPNNLKFTPEAREAFLGALRACGVKKYACGAAGITHTTLGEWMNRGRSDHSGPYWEFYREVRKVEQQVKIILMGRIIAAASKDWRAAEAALNRLDPQARQVKFGGLKNGEPIKFQAQKPDLSKLTDEQLDQLEALLEQATPADTH